MTKKLKPTHYDVLSRLAARHDGRLRRLPGAFWTDDPEAVEYQQGDWNTVWVVVKALLALSLVQPDREDFVLTELGVTALRTGVYPC
jgi:hypothetical protein